METQGLIDIGNRYHSVRVSPTLLAIREMLNEHVTKTQQEPKVTAFVSSDPNMIEAFKAGKDIYSTIAGLAFNLPYEQCLEFHPETHEYQPEGKARRGEAKTIVLGICYGRSVVTIGDQLFGTRDDMTQEEKTAAAQKVYDAVLNAFPNLRSLMVNAQGMARKKGYVETILGRRRHIPDMMLPEFEFKALPGYVNPDIDPLDVNTLQNKSDIPERIVKDLEKEFKSYKYFGQIARRTKELYEEGIRVINHRNAITEASRQCVNCVDYSTEIYTLDGWKHVSEIHEGDKIISFDVATNRLVEDEIKQIHIYGNERGTDSYNVVRIFGDKVSACSSINHRWPVFKESSGKVEFVNSSTLYEVPDVADGLLFIDSSDLGENQSITTKTPVHTLNTSNRSIVLDVCDRVWCVTTTQGTWICRRDGKVLVTGNSIVQGSAADMTKMAILRLDSDEQWADIGGRLLVPVHDELMCEVPMECWKEGGDILSRVMSEAGNFLPFPINCDVTTTLRWYGVEYPCPYEKPTSMSNLSEDNIKWIQWHLYDLEYVLPVIKVGDEKPRGDAALGVNGIVSDEYNNAIHHYLNRYSISEDQFIEHIEARVLQGS